MTSRIAQYCARLIEAGWLVAVIAVPLFFNVWSNRVFEPDKLTLLRSVALVMAAAGLAWRIECGGWSRAALRAWLTRPLVVPVLLVTGVYALATATSVTPWLSLTGSYNRLQGSYTWLAYVVVFLAIVTLLSSRDQVERLVSALIVPSLPVALYGVIQKYGLDPMPWLGDVESRVASTMGNSIFVSAYLIMVVPLTLGRLFAAVRDLDEESETGALTYAAILRVASYLVLVAFQLGTIVLSQSRGPLLGLLGGLFVGALLVAARYRGRKAMLGVLMALGVAPALFLIVFNLPNSPLAPLRSVPYIGRLGRVFETESGTGKVRVLIWDGTIDLITANPVRTVIGWGPESMHWAYNPYYPPELGNYESRNASPDRSHNETLDALATTGVIGFVAYMFLFTSLFLYGLRWLELIASAGDRNVFLGLWFGGGVLAALAFQVFTGKATYFGVALPAGMVAGLPVYVVLRVLRGWSPAERPGMLLMIGLFASLIAHFIEIHFGIAIAATRTLFFAMAGLLVVLGTMDTARMAAFEAGVDAPADTAEPASRSQARRRRAAAARRGSGSGPPTPPTWAWAGQAFIMVTVLVTLGFDFVVMSQPKAEDLGPMLWLFALTFIIGSLLLFSETVIALVRRGWWNDSVFWAGAVTYGGLSLGVALAYIFSHWSLLASARPGSGADTSSALLGMYYLMALILLAMWAWVLARQDPDPGRVAGTRAAWLYPLAGLAAIVVALFSNLNEVRADIYYKEGWNGYHVNGRYDEAVIDYDRAIVLDPREDYFLLFKGKALLEKADTDADTFEQAHSDEIDQADFSEYAAGTRAEADARDHSFQSALDVLSLARALAPLNTDHYANLARAYQIWGDRTFDRSRRAERLAESRKWFLTAIGAGLSPRNAGLREELATTEFLDGKTGAAMQRLDEAMQIDPKFKQPYRVRARIYRQLDEWEKAEADYRTYLESPEGRGDASAWSELAYVLGQLDDRQGAKEANLKVLEIAERRRRKPDTSTLSNLAILARDQGERDEACGYVERGLAVDKDDATLLNLAEELNCPLPPPTEAITPTGGAAP